MFCSDSCGKDIRKGSDGQFEPCSRWPGLEEPQPRSLHLHTWYLGASLSLSPHCISTLAWILRVDTNLTRLLASMKETYEAARTTKGYAQEISTESLPSYLFIKVVQKMPRFKFVEE